MSIHRAVIVRAAVFGLISLFAMSLSSPAHAQMIGKWLMVAEPLTDGACGAPGGRALVAQWDITGSATKATRPLKVRALGDRAFPTLTGSQSSRSLELRGVSASPKSWGKTKVADGVYYWLELEGAKLMGTRYLVTHRRTKAGVMVPCFRRWSVSATRKHGGTGAARQAHELVDTMADAMWQMLVDIDAAHGDQAAIQAVSARFKAFAEANKLRGEAVTKKLSAKEKKEVDAYARLMMAPLMGRFMAAMMKHHQRGKSSKP